MYIFSHNLTELISNSFVTVPMGILKVYTKAVAQMCSIKKVFLKISQNLLENTCARVYFLTIFY